MEEHLHTDVDQYFNTFSILLPADHCSPREEVLRLDRRLHHGLCVHLPADVDHQAGVRRVRPIHRPQEVLLSRDHLHQHLDHRHRGHPMTAVTE